MRLHSAVSLITNSSGEVFVARRDQVPDNVDDIINSLWVIWFTQHADEWEKMKFDINFEPAFLFEMDTMENEENEHYGRSFTQADACTSFFDRLFEVYSREPVLPGEAPLDAVQRVIDGNEDVKLLFEFYVELRLQAKQEEGYPTWLWEARHYVGELAVEAGLFDDIEDIVACFVMNEGTWGQWRWVKRDFDLYHAYDGAELQGEIDDHVYPQGFVKFVCSTLGWFTYHNG